MGKVSKPVRVVVPGKGPVLRVQVPVKVRDSGLFALETRLSRGTGTILYLGLRRDLGEGEHTLTVDLPGEEIAGSRVDGSYAVTVNLHLLDPMTAIPLKPLDSARVESGPFRARAFRSR